MDAKSVGKATGIDYHAIEKLIETELNLKYGTKGRFLRAIREIKVKYGLPFIFANPDAHSVDIFKIL
mgnify:CR=1 FL=1